MIRKILTTLLLGACVAFSGYATDVDAVIRVLGEDGKPLSGAVIKVPGTELELNAGEDGLFRLSVEKGTMVVILKPDEYMCNVAVTEGNMTVRLDEADRILSLGYNRFETRRTGASAIGGVVSSDISGSVQPQVLNSLYGLVPGLRVKTNGTEPWGDASLPELTIRGNGSYMGNSVLVLVDGVQRDPAAVDVAEVQSVTVLKDAASLAMYGHRGADGAVLITTKRGGEKKMRLHAGYKFGVQTPVGVPEMATPSQYAAALNEAYANDGLAPYYTQSDLAAIASGNGLIPTADWKNLVLRKAGFNHEAFFTMDGSTKGARYFVYADVRTNRGFFANTKLTDGMSTQLEYTGMKLRSNLDIDVTKTTELSINLAARLQQQNQPVMGTGLGTMYTTPTVGIPERHDGIWTKTNLFENPLEYIHGRGYNSLFSRMLVADLTLRQRLDVITKGLHIEARVSYDNSANTYDRKTFNSSYQIPLAVRDAQGNISGYDYADYGNDTEIDFGTGLSSQYIFLDIWAKLGYERMFGRHSVKAAAVFNRSRRSFSGANNKFTWHDYILGADYSYSGKYFVSATATMAGSAKLMTDDKFRFFPAVSAGWMMSEERFMKGCKALDMLKLRASVGVTGKDEWLSYDMDKQFNGTGRYFLFSGNSAVAGQQEGSLPATSVEPEREMRIDFGVEFALFHSLSGEVSLFRNHRKNIRNVAGNVVSNILGVGITDNFTGEMENRGLELALSWKKRSGNFLYHIGGNFSFARNRILAINEEYAPSDRLYREGKKAGAFYGLVSDGFYQKSDFDDSGNLLPGVPKSTFADVQPGDVKYVDFDGNGKIDKYDNKYFDKSLYPEFHYGFQLGLEWKGLGFNAWFNGAGNHYVVTNLPSIYQPLYGGNKNISSHYLKSYWSADSPSGRYPRLTSKANANNYLASDLWTEKGDFLKLRELEIYYSFQDRLPVSWKIESAKVFVRGNNLLSFDHVDIFDPEYISTGYPLARTFTIGLDIVF